jgi:hypothetical protein
MSAIDAGLVGTLATSPAAAPRIAFRAHPRLPWMLVPDGIPMQVLIDVVPVRVPNTRTWFRGVVSQRGNLLPVFDLGGWAGLAPIDAKTLIVAVGVGATACAVVCAATPTLLVPGAPLREDDADANAMTSIAAFAPYLGPACASVEGSVREFDFQRWLATAAQDISSAASG